MNDFAFYLSHVGRPEHGRDDEDVADHAADDHQGVEEGQCVVGGVGYGLVVHNILTVN